MCKNCLNNNLAEEILNEVSQLKVKGEKEFEKKQFDKAKDFFFEALNLIHEPIQHYSEATKLLVAIGDCYFHMNKFEECYSFFSRAIQGVDGFGDPFIHLRIGQMYYEREEYDKSSLELRRAYLLGGKEMFDNEDLKYYTSIEKELS